MMFGSNIFGHKEVISEILEHTVFKKRSGTFTTRLVQVFGQLYIKLFGWPVQEPRIYHPKLIRLLEPCSSDLILDVGCGYGIHALEIASRYQCAITGIDVDEDDIQFANKVSMINHIENCRFSCMDAVELDFDSDSFNKIICMAVLEHIEDDNSAVRNMARVLQEDGILVGVVPGDRKSRLNPDVMQKADDPKGHGHVREGYSPQEIENLLGRNGLELVHYEYVSGRIESLMFKIQSKTNQYITFPFTYPISYFSDCFSSYGGGILFKAIKKSDDNGAKST